MSKNIWLEFVKEDKKRYPDLKYGDILSKASKSPEWERYKKKHKNKPNYDNVSDDNETQELKECIEKLVKRLSIIEKKIKH